MATSVPPLHDLAHRISQHEAELQQLRQHYDAQHNQLKTLTRRKEELQAQLQQVESELQGVGKGSVAAGAQPAVVHKPTAQPTPAKKPAAKTVLAKPTASPASTAVPQKVSLPQLMLNILTQAKRPMTVKELHAEVVRRNYPTKSSDLSAIVDTRVHELLNKKLLRRGKDRDGVLQVEATGAAPSGTAHTNGSVAQAAPKTPLAAKSTAAAPAAASSGMTLSAAVTKVLAGSTKPLSAKELADKVLALGYKSSAKDFTNRIWSGISKFENVENVPGQGYRLKPSKAAASKDKGGK